MTEYTTSKKNINESHSSIKLRDSFEPPQELEHIDFYLEILAPKHNEIDFEAWSSSRKELKGIFGPRNNWPSEVSSLEHNLKDLKNHLREFQEKEAFTYTILSPDKNECIGCLYIRPTKSNQHNCRVDYWFRNSYSNLDFNFYSWLKIWLSTEWDFKSVAFPGRNIRWDEYYDLTDSMSFLTSSHYQENALKVYEKLKEKMTQTIHCADIEHIGSSSVPGSVSKGDLDIYVGVNSNQFSESLEKLLGLGYQIKENTFRNDELCMFEIIEDGIDVGIQLVDNNSTHTNFLKFRDILLSSKELRDDYNKLKKEATGLSPFEYRKIKSKFIKSVLFLVSLNEKELEYWNSYLGTLEDKPASPNVEAGISGNDEIADELLKLYLSGKKTAGSGLVKDYELAGDPLPKVGNYWIILDSKKEPKCIVKTARVEFYQFDQVPEEVAIAEGEGDLSLEYWRKSHIDFFTPFLKDWGISDLDKETLVTEFYGVVFK